MIRRIDRIRKMSLDELSPYLIHRASLTDKWLSPSGRTCEYYDNALTDCEEWLDGEYKREEEEGYDFGRNKEKIYRSLSKS